MLAVIVPVVTMGVIVPVIVGVVVVGLLSLGVGHGPSAFRVSLEYSVVRSWSLR